MYFAKSSFVLHRLHARLLVFLLTLLLSVHVPLSVRCEQLLGVNGKLRQELMLIGELIPDLQERLGHLLQVLIQRYRSRYSQNNILSCVFFRS